MKHRLKTEPQLHAALHTLADDVQVAAVHHHLATDLSAAVPQYVRELNEACAFWSLTIYAHLSEVRTRLCRVYDQHPAAIGLATWLAAAAGIAKLDSSTLTSDLSEVGAADPIVRKLVKLRNNVVAHTAASPVGRRELEQAFGLTFEESDMLVRRAVRIVNDYGQRLLRNTWSTRIIGRDDYLSVLRAVRFHDEAMEAKIQAEFDGAGGAT
jgi:HEPN superfamily AbiU2-like protein